MSIIRIGLAETKNFSQGYDAIFGQKKATPAVKTKAPVAKAKAKAPRSKGEGQGNSKEKKR